MALSNFVVVRSELITGLQPYSEDHCRAGHDERYEVRDTYARLEKTRVILGWGRGRGGDGSELHYLRR